MSGGQKAIQVEPLVTTAKICAATDAINAHLLDAQQRTGRSRVLMRRPKAGGGGRGEGCQHGFPLAWLP